MSKQNDGPWPTNEGVSPIRSIPRTPGDVKRTLFSVIHFPYVGQKFRISNHLDVYYRVSALDLKTRQVQLIRDVEDGPWTMSYYIYLPLDTWWAMTMRRALGISGGSVDSWKLALEAVNDPWAFCSTTTTGSLTCHIYEISFNEGVEHRPVNGVVHLTIQNNGTLAA